VWFSTGKGGATDSLYDSLNTSTLVAGNQDAALKNHLCIEAAVGGRPSPWMRQVAGERP
jgi:hypothetical protein